MSKELKLNTDLLEHFVDFLGLEETINILKLKPNQLLKTARVNFLKITRQESIIQLLKEGIIAKKDPYLAEGLIIKKGWNKIGSSQSYLSGYVMPQGYGSMLAVDSLNPIPGETILDMTAAPGGKSCFIGERLKEKGTLIANEKSHKRIQSLIHNIMRQGIVNSIVTRQDALDLKIDPVDRVLLDAPCSGDGLIVSNPVRRTSKTLINSYSMQRIQISLLSKALSLLKPNGICLYSTCSINAVENELVLRHFIDEFTIEKIEIPGNPGSSKIHPDFKNTKRLLPSKQNCDGFFIAKLRKH